MTGTTLVLLLLAQAGTGWSGGIFVEPRSESLVYRFENPSRYDTSELVPHSFQQTYDTDNLWLGARAGHPFFKRRGRFEAAMSPAATRRADDFDTFHQPDGNVIVTGTTGNATLRGWRISDQVFLGSRKGVAFGLGYAHRHDHARFHDGDGITTTAMPASVVHRLVTTREDTTSQLHVVSWIAETSRDVGRRGSFAVRADIAPLARARLTVVLPDKYPGQRLVFDARIAAASFGVRYAWMAGKWSVGAGAKAGRTFGWQRSARMTLRSLSVSLDLQRH
ncbi:MAG: hypothetical protein A3G21_18490 [Acidobacteria bacterium RIFCSPLOWO2_12_FULL_66_21]|nr:MAG: hypothetical protein A3G21_18490 [Acidobacteria bacterium RIFCSPLOWO2_12_FULL_66_21]